MKTVANIFNFVSQPISFNYSHAYFYSYKKVFH